MKNIPLLLVLTISILLSACAPQQTIDESCRFKSVFECTNHTVSKTNNTIELHIKNFDEKTIEIQQISITGTDNNRNRAVGITKTTIPSGEKKRVYANISKANNLDKTGEKYTYEIVIVYTLQESQIQQMVRGTLITTIS